MAIRSFECAACPMCEHMFNVAEVKQTCAFSVLCNLSTHYLIQNFKFAFNMRESQAITVQHYVLCI